MDVLMGVVLGKHTEPIQHAQQGQMPRPGRHVLPEGRVGDLPPVLKARTAFPGTGFCMSPVRPVAPRRRANGTWTLNYP
jgi:hypothetical protein